MKKLIIFSSLIIALSSCKKENKPTPFENKKSGTNDIMPLSMGNIWKYKYKMFTPQGSIQSETDFELKPVTTFEENGTWFKLVNLPDAGMNYTVSRIDHRTINEYSTTSGDNPVFFKDTDTEEVIYEKFIEFRFDSNYTDYKVSYPQSVTVNGFETKLNKYFQIREYVQTGQKDTVFCQDIYMSNGIGIVKIEGYKFGGTKSLQYSYELTGYNLQ